MTDTPEETMPEAAPTEEPVLNLPLGQVKQGFFALLMDNGEVQLGAGFTRAKPDLGDLAMLAYAAGKAFESKLLAAEVVKMVHADQARAVTASEELSIREKIMKGLKH